MANLNHSVSKVSAYAYAELPITYPVRFWLFVFSDSLSILCCLFVLFNFLHNRQLRESLNNHVLIVILLLDLVLECVCMPLTIHYYRLNGIWNIHRPFSQIWTYLNFGFYPTKTIVFAWCTIERHIFIFHSSLFNSWKNRLILHYFPLIVVPLYGLIYYAIVVFGPFCDYLYFQSTINGVFIACFMVDPFMSKFDLIAHQIVPVLIIIIFTFALYIRFVWQKANLRQSMQWRKQRKLLIQILLIFVIFAGFQFPWTILQLCGLFGFPLDTLGNARNYMFFFGYYVVFLFPFVCFATLPDIEKKVKTFFCLDKQRIPTHTTAMAVGTNRSA